MLSVSYIINVGGLLNFEPTYGMYLRMLLNLNDQPAKKVYEDKSTFKSCLITSSHRKNCLKERKLAKKIRQQLKMNYDENGENNSDEEEHQENMTIEADWVIEDTAINEKSDVIGNYQDVAVDESCSGLHISIMENGLFDDYEYYFTPIPFVYRNSRGQEVTDYKEYTVGRYHYSESHVHDPSRNSEFQLLFSSTYQSLEKPKWLDGQVIDAIATVYERNWNEAVFIRTIMSAFLFQDKWVDGRNNSILPDDNWYMFKASFPASGKIFIPIHRINHWRLLVFDLDERKVRLYDPREVNFEEMRPEFERITTHFARYHRLCRSKNIINSFTACDFEEWTFEWHNSVSTDEFYKRTYQIDGHSCGVFLLYLMNVIAGAEQLDENFDPDRRRTVMANMLLRESDDMHNICIFCFNDSTAGENIRCKSCNRPVHIRCINNEDNMLVSGVCELCAKQRK